MKKSATFLFISLLLFLVSCSDSSPTTDPSPEQQAVNPGPGLPQASYRAGEPLYWSKDHGGRLAVFHRGWLWFPGRISSTVWDISNPRSPRLVDDRPKGDNGHIYWQMGDLFNGHLWGGGHAQDLSNGESLYLNLSDTPNWTAYTEDIGFSLKENNMRNFPYAVSHTNARDMRTGERYRFDKNLAEEAGVSGTTMFSVGNLLFLFRAPANTRSGVAVYDFADPQNPKLLDVLEGQFNQYSSEIAIYKHYIIMLVGKNESQNVVDGKPYKAIAIDFSDPSNLKVADKYRWNDNGRYIEFQDNFGFTGGRKINMDTDQDDLRFPSVRDINGPRTGPVMGDFYWLPVGNMVINADGQTSYEGFTIYAHQTEPDRRAPSVAYHQPANNATNLAVTSRIGLVIHETLQAETVNDQSIRVRPVGGQAIEGHVLLADYDVITFAPKQPLRPNTTYIVELVSGGIKDVAGNGIRPYSFRFSTGSTINNPNPSPNPTPDPTPNPTPDPTPAPSPAPSTDLLSLALVNADSDQIVPGYETIASGQTISTSNLNLTSFNLAAVVNPNHKDAKAVRSVGFNTSFGNRTENAAPYALFGDVGGNYAGRTLSNGEFTVTIEAYSGFSRTGTRLGSTSITYKVASSGPAPNPNPNPGPSPTAAPEIRRIATNPGSPVTVNTEVAFQAMASNATQFRWKVGGNNYTNWRDFPTYKYTFKQTGNFSIIVQARNAQGDTIAATTQMVVNAVAKANQPTRSNQMALNKRQLWTVNPDNNSVSIVDADKLQLLKEIPGCQGASSVAMDAYQQAWVSCYEEDALWVLDTNSLQAKTKVRLDYGSAPISILASPNGHSIFVAEEGKGQITKINAQNRGISNRLIVGPSPRALAMTSDGKRLLVTRLISSGQQAEVWSINPDTMQQQNTFTLAIDTSTLDGTANSRGLPNYLLGLAISPSDLEAWVTAKKDNIVRGIYRDGKALTHETTLRAFSSVLDLANNKEANSRRLEIDDHGMPSAVAYDPAGNFVFMTMQGKRKLVALDARTGESLVITDTEFAPQSLLIDPTNQRLFVKNFLSRSLSVFGANELINQNLPRLTSVTTVKTVRNETLDSTILKGKQLFYDSADTKLAKEGYLSCASCHLDGNHDGQTWDLGNLGEGLRNTIDLRGHPGSKRGRLHWSKNFNEVQDFEHQIRDLAAGTGLLSDKQLADHTVLGRNKAGLSKDLDALAAYVNSLSKVPRSPYRTRNGSLTFKGTQGKAVFNELSCGSCHLGNRFTDGKFHNVGTLKATSGKRLNQNLSGIRTPTLKGIWATAPYLHDGSAADLRAVFTSAQSGPHKKAAQLTRQKQDQLIAYLKQIDEREGAQQDLGAKIRNLSSEPVSLVLGRSNTLMRTSVDVMDNAVNFNALELLLSNSLSSNIEQISLYVDKNANGLIDDGPAIARSQLGGQQTAVELKPDAALLLGQGSQTQFIISVESSQAAANTAALAMLLGLPLFILGFKKRRGLLGLGLAFLILSGCNSGSSPTNQQSIQLVSMNLSYESGHTVAVDGLPIERQIDMAK